MTVAETLAAVHEPAPPTGLHLAPESGSDGLLLESLLSSVNCTVLGGGSYAFPPEWTLAERVRPNYILFIGTGGRAEFTIGGQCHALEPGDLLLAPPLVPQAARHDPAHPLRLYTVHFVARLYGVLDAPAVFGLPVALRPAPARLVRIVEAARRIISELAAREPGCALSANGECARIVALLWREALAQAGGGPLTGAARAAELARLAPVFRTIRARYGERLTLEELAEVVHLHPAYFSTLFRKITGLPPLHYLGRYRLERTRELLLSTDQPVRRIATATGFRDPFYLSRVFRRAEGVSPSDYRRARKSPAVP